MAPNRLAVAKTYKLYIGGAFPRSESGRTYQIADTKGAFVANVALASRKDARDAVVAARKAVAGWSGTTAYNRGQVLYRVAEMLEGRAAQFADLLTSVEGLSKNDARAQVDAAVDRWVHFAGWTDKITSVFGSSNSVAGPFFSFTSPEPTGVVVVVAPPGSSLLGLVSVIAPAICSGNAVVALTDPDKPLPAVTLAEVLATSDLPGGVVNILTGDPAQTLPQLAAHADVNALDLTGVTGDARAEAQRLASGTVKRVFAPRSFDPAAEPGTGRIRAFVEFKTVWHPTGAVSLGGGSGY